MTRLLFLPTDQTFLWLDSLIPAEEVVEAVLGGQWGAAEPYGAALAQLISMNSRYQAFQQGSLSSSPPPSPWTLRCAPSPGGVFRYDLNPAAA